jgi:hypothetical protein
MQGIRFRHWLIRLPGSAGASMLQLQMKSFDTGSKSVNIAGNVGAASTEVWVSIRASARLDAKPSQRCRCWQHNFMLLDLQIFQCGTNSLSNERDLYDPGRLQATAARSPPTKCGQCTGGWLDYLLHRAEPVCICRGMYEQRHSCRLP